MKKSYTFFALVSFLIIYNCTFNIENCKSQWQSDVRLTYNPDTSRTSYQFARCIASSGNFVHAVWYDKRNGNNEIYYKHSTDGGFNWGADVRLTNYDSSSVTPAIAVSGSNVHVVWTDKRDGNNEIYYKRSTDAGVTWGADVRLTSDPGNSHGPSIAAPGNLVCIVFGDNRNSAKWEIYCLRSTDAGLNWTAETRLTNALVWSVGASIAISGSNIHIVWEDQRDGNYEIYYKRSTDGGNNWLPDFRLTNAASHSYFTSIAISGSVIHVVWIDYRDGNLELYYKNSIDGGISWSADTRLTNNVAESYHPNVAVSGSNIHIVWTDGRDGNREIYYKLSTDGGINWGPDTRLTYDPAESYYPSMSISNSALHVLWSDYRDGNYEIYYKRNPTGNITSIENINSEIPKEYKLMQNYPNPFNPTTKIKFSIVSSPHGLGGDLVQLKVYDVMGRVVQTLVNEKFQPGTYEATFDGSKLTSGVYFYKLVTDGFTEIRKMILIK